MTLDLDAIKEMTGECVFPLMKPCYCHPYIPVLIKEVERLREMITKDIGGNFHFRRCKNPSWPIAECGCMEKYVQEALDE